MANTDYRDAVRIMFLLNESPSEPNSDAETRSEFPIRVIGETRIQALDFWIRYPDYLADELLAQYEQNGDRNKLIAAMSIFQANEPSERAIPMLRRYFGAYEPLDTVLAILAMSRLVRAETIPNTTGGNTQRFLISPQVETLCKLIIDEHPIFVWYRDRARLVVEVSSGRGGAALKVRQHEQKEYHESRVGDLIPTIAARVQKKLEEITP